jgi:CubicO group peptidase (beta-lactamase class C family)
MTRFSRFGTAITATAATAALVAAPSPAHAAPGAYAPPTVDVAKMRTEIVESLRSRAVGFGYAIAKDGKLAKSGGGGLARRAVDGRLRFSSAQRMEVMSVTKNVTAVAMLKLLDANDIPVDTPVDEFLPDGWSKGFGFWGSNGATFRDLLAHTSGLGQAATTLSDTSQWGNDWDGLEWIVLNGATPGSPYAYKNANYALFRVLIPELWRRINPSVPVVTEANSWEQTLAYIQQHLLEPIGVHQVTCWPANPAKAPLAYPRRYVLGKGKLVKRNGSGLGACGGHAGLHLSARDLVRFQVHLRHTNQLLPAHVREQMDDLELGWNPSSNGSTDSGTAGKFWHGGGGHWGKGSKRREINTCVMKLPYGVEAALLVNSPIAGGRSPCGILKDSFNDAL